VSSIDIVNLRNWYWRGWQIRYGFVRAIESEEKREVPVLLIHGFGAAIAHWRKNQANLAQNHHVYAIDLIGFGASEKAAVLYNAELWVEQVYQFWRTTIQEPMVICGNSVGAMVAILAAAKYPEMVKGVVGISIPDLAELDEKVPKAIRPLRRSLEATIGGLVAIPAFNLIKQPGIIRWVLKTLVYGDRKVESVTDELVEIIAAPARERRSATAFLYLNRGMNSVAPNVKEAIAKLEVPLLILWGTKDRIIPPAIAEKLVTYSPLAKLIYLEGIGHCPQDEDPERVNQEVLLWIDSLS
jgi:pimeloyl-ACP methyl ester carboxylesterase